MRPESSAAASVVKIYGFYFACVFKVFRITQRTFADFMSQVPELSVVFAGHNSWHVHPVWESIIEVCVSNAWNTFFGSPFTDFSAPSCRRCESSAFFGSWMYLFFGKNFGFLQIMRIYCIYWKEINKHVLKLTILPLIKADHEII